MGLKDQVVEPVEVLLCVGPTGVGQGAVWWAVEEAARLGLPLRLLHVIARDEEPYNVGHLSRRLTMGSARLAQAEKRARGLAAGRVVVVSELAHGPVVATLVDQSIASAVVVLERPAAVELAGAVLPPSTIGTVSSLATAPVVTVPSFWRPTSPAEQPLEEGLPAAWLSVAAKPVVTVVMDDPADCRPAVEAGISAAEAREATVEFLHAWAADGAVRRPGESVRNVSTRSVLVVVGRRDDDEPLSGIGRTAVHESACPVLVVAADERRREALAPVVSLRRVAQA